jgi:hypothetical protein
VAHEPGAVGTIGLVLVVSGTPEPEVRHRRFAPAGHGNDVIELQEPVLAAASALAVDVSALVDIS